MEENLSAPKMWASIARKIPGRNQHQIKNRVISLLKKDLCTTRAKINEMLKNGDCLAFLALSMKVVENLKSIQRNNEEKQIFLEEPSKICEKIKFFVKIYHFNL